MAWVLRALFVCHGCFDFFLRFCFSFKLWRHKVLVVCEQVFHIGQPLLPRAGDTPDPKNRWAFHQNPN